MKPFIYSATIGNGRILATLGSDGELHRLYWPHIDMSQHINMTWAALLSPALGDRAIRLSDGETWTHTQEYVNDTNIVKTECCEKYGRFHINALDFVAPERDILVRCFEITNTTDKPVPAALLYYSSLYIDESRLYNANYYEHETDTLFHHRRDVWMAVAGERVPNGYQSGIGGDDALYGNLNGNRISMTPDACQAWDLGSLQPGESRAAAVFIAGGSSREQAQENVFYARKRGWDGLLKETEVFWETYLGRAYLPRGAAEDVRRLFRRSVMVCKLLMNRESGGIIAAPEFDESCTSCGGYAFCWPRDATIIAQAMLKAGYPEYARDFYRWAAKYQDPDGGWPQRQYTNGQLAPRWGYQIDETGTVLWGMSRYYQETWDTDFLEEVWPAAEKAAEFLMRFLDVDTGLPGMSWDLWEERFGEHAYSCAAVYAGLKAAGLMAKALRYSDQALRWLEASMAVREKIIEYFWDAGLDRFIRTGWVYANRNVYEERRLAGRPVREVSGPRGYITHEVFGDDTADASLLGLTFPFGVIAPDDPRMQKTVRHLVDILANPGTGGIGRYQRDAYIGGNPWVVTTLWLGLFEGAAGNWDSAAGYLRWALEHQTELGLLPEQVDCRNGRPAWVVPLAWSHAMYLLLVNMMSEAGELLRRPS